LSNTESMPDRRQQMFAELMDASADDENAAYLASMLASWYTGVGVLPAYMGLTPETFHAMLQRFFPAFTQLKLAQADKVSSDMPEQQELASLFAADYADDDEMRAWIADILIAGCAGRRHLWEDLGLFTRKDLTDMMHANFPQLAQRNTRDMKWKKFIYKQLCEREGIIACPAPTCDACADFSVCFAPEDEPSD